ncbi:MAG: hypothetical protein PHQ28_00825 [Mycobacterium sp.]|nr:hypothetical protein [Mycobacterium sp.]
MKVTVVPTMYRDAANWKVQGEIHLRGELTSSLKETLRSALDEGLYYGPRQLGLDHYGSGGFSSFPTDDDHGLQEMLLDEVVVVERDPSARLLVMPNTEDGGTVDEFVAKVVAAARAGWNPTLHAG